MPKIGRAAGATISGVRQGSDEPVLFSGKTIRITDGAIEFSPTPGAVPDLRLERGSDGALSVSSAAVDHDWTKHGWSALRQVVITAHGSQSFTPSVSSGRGTLTATSASSANHRVAYLHPKSNWADSQVTSLIYGPTADWATNNAQMGHLHRVREVSSGLYEGIAIWTSVTGGGDFGYLHANAVRFDGTTLTQGTNADSFLGPFGYGDLAYIDRRAQVIGIQRSQPLLWANDYRVARPDLLTVTDGDVIDIADLSDTTFNETGATIVSVIDTAAGVIRITESVTQSAVAYTAVKAGHITPSGVDSQKRYCPFYLASRVIGGSASSVTIEAKRWRPNEHEPDWGDARVQRAATTPSASVTSVATAAGLCGLWGAHFYSSSGGAWGQVRFEQVAA